MLHNNFSWLDSLKLRNFSSERLEIFRVILSTLNKQGVQNLQNNSWIWITWMNIFFAVVTYFL